MNFPANNALASRKLEQLSTARQLGLAVPDTVLTQDQDVLRRFFQKHDGQVIVKPLGRAYIERSKGENDSLIYTNSISEHDLNDLADLATCPTYFQKAIRKRSDVRITCVDGDTHAMELLAQDHGQQRCDIRRNNMSDVSYRSLSLPDDIALKVRQLTAHYCLRFAALDMAVDTEGMWYFFEVNPNGQWAWLDLCGGASIHKSFIASFAVAAKHSRSVP
jgi:glutathione synthase/RimK-type ligase-like ATP-grasp enzyme